MERIREEIKHAGEEADALERILSNLTDPETRRKAEQVAESYRLQAIRLNEHLEMWIKKKPSSG